MSNNQRALVTAGVALAVLGLQLVVLPGVDGAVVRATAGSWHVPSVSLGALGLGPVVLAFVLVELAAAAVPRWRPLRVGGPAGRARLARPTLALAVVLSALQAWGVSMWLDGLYLGYEPFARTPRYAVVSALSLATALHWALARVVDRHGLGGGFAVLLGVGAAIEWATMGAYPVWLAQQQGAFPPGALLLSGAVLVLVAWGVVALLSGKVPHTTLPLPLCGVLPLGDAVSVLRLVASLPLVFGYSLMLPAPLSFAAVCGVAVVSALVLSVLLHRPAHVAALTGRPVDAVRAEVKRLTLISLGVVAGGLFAAYVLDRTVRPPMGAVSMVLHAVLVAAVASDLVGEWRFRTQHPDAAAAWPVIRSYARAPALEALATAEIPAFERSGGLRTLLQLFGPYAPATLLVPAPQLRDAQGRLAARLGGSSGPVRDAPVVWPALALIAALGAMELLVPTPPQAGNSLLRRPPEAASAAPEAPGHAVGAAGAAAGQAGRISGRAHPLS